jgi:threonine dehydratase
VALAAVLSEKIDCRDKTIAVVLSGGNVDPQTYSAVMRGDL